MRLILVILAGLLASCSTEQRVDSRADVSVAQPRHPSGHGPRVAIDGGHGNLHTENGSFAPFAALLRNDGMRVSGLAGPITAAALAETDLLVIANAERPGGGSAFTAAEIDAVESFVDGGGGLLLIADHIPYPAAAADLARRFGVTLHNVFADNDEDEVFTVANGGLARDPLLAGIVTVKTFGGSTLEAPDPAARPLLRLWPGWTVQTMQGGALSPERPAGNVLQGVAIERGAGRVAIFGEAAMFTAQKTGLMEKIGFNATGAEQNKQLVLNVVRWLARVDADRRGSVAAGSRRP
jgi:hypothetical protein